MATEAAQSIIVVGMALDDGQPQLRVRAPGIDSRLVSAAGFRLGYTIDPSSPRWCVGSSRLEGDCKDQAQPGRRTCTQCSIADALHASSLHHAHTRDPIAIDADVRDHLNQPNLLYLAAFRDGSIKVGTSTETRIDKRLTEQGAWTAQVVRRSPNGYEVRHLEDLVTEGLGIPQAVATARKLQGLAQPRSDDELQLALDTAVTSVEDFFAASPLTSGTLEPGSETLVENQPRWRHRCATDEVWSTRLRPYPARLDAGSHQLTIVAVCGRVAAVTRRDSDGQDDTATFVIDLGQLLGVELQLGSYEPVTISVQENLF